MATEDEKATKEGMSSFQKSILMVYFVLFFTCIALLVGSEFLGPKARETVLPIASDGFKLVLGALIGTLSTLFSSKKQTS